MKISSNHVFWVLQLNYETRVLQSQYFRFQLPDTGSSISEVETENRSLNDDLKRCELEARQLNTQLDAMKLDYEQLVHDRDREISLVTVQPDDMKQDMDIVLGQRDQAKADLLGCHNQLDLLQARFNEHQSNNQLDLQKEVLFVYLILDLYINLCP